jgi:hypothetical protein
LAACIEEPQPRSYLEFMDDRVAREGTLVRCNTDRDATGDNPECINARRAAATLAARADAAQREQREAESESGRLAARQYQEAREAAMRRAEAAAIEEQQLAYEAQWHDGAAASTPAATAVIDEATPQTDGSAVPKLEFIALPRSVTPPLTTVTLPRGVKPLEYTPPTPRLEEISLPERRMTP